MRVRKELKEKGLFTLCVCSIERGGKKGGLGGKKGKGKGNGSRLIFFVRLGRRKEGRKKRRVG